MQVFAQGRQIVFKELAGKVVDRVEIEQETGQIAFCVHCEDGTSLELTFSTVVTLNYAGIGCQEGEDVAHTTLYTAVEPSLVDTRQPCPPGEIFPGITKGKILPFGIR